MLAIIIFILATFFNNLWTLTPKIIANIVKTWIFPSPRISRQVDYSSTRKLDSFESIFLILELDFCLSSSTRLVRYSKLHYSKVLDTRKNPVRPAPTGQTISSRPQVVGQTPGHSVNPSKPMGPLVGIHKSEIGHPSWSTPPLQIISLGPHFMGSISGHA